MRNSGLLIAERNLRMKTNSFLTSIFVSEKTRKRAQRINAFLKAGGRESETEVVSAADSYTESAFTQG